MKKEFILFGAVVVVCLGVTAFALKKPKPKPTETSSSSSSSFSSTDFSSSSGTGSSSYSSGSSSSGSPSPLGTTDSFSSTSSFPPTADLNPNKPFDSGTGFSTGTGTGTGSTGSLPPGNPFPGSSTSGTGSSTGSSTSFPGSSTSSTSFPGSSTSGTGSSSSSFPGSSTSGTGSSTGSSSLGTSSLTALPTSGETRTHTIAKGETLSDISRKYYGSSKHWRKIADANSVKEDGLQPGMKLTIPPLDTAPAATATDTTAATGSEGTYVVKKGDSYYKIAKKELGDASRYKEIEKLNGIAPEDLHEGQKLKLPAKVTAAASTDSGSSLPGPETAAAAGGRTHTVGEGEYLSDISKKYYGSTKHWQEIVKANPGLTPERLKVGQKIVIPDLPGKAASSAGAAPATAVAADEYVVKKGDTFEVIASKVLGDKKLWKKIQDVNPGVDPSALKIGQKIKLPAGATNTTPAPIPAPLPALPTPAFPAPTPALPAPGGASSTTDPWSTLPTSGTASSPTSGYSTTSFGTGTGSSTGTGTSGTGTSGTGTGTSSTYSDPWRDFPTTTGTGTGTGTSAKP